MNVRRGGISPPLTEGTRRCRPRTVWTNCGEAGRCRCALARVPLCRTANALLTYLLTRRCRRSLTRSRRAASAAMARRAPSLSCRGCRSGPSRSLARARRRPSREGSSPREAPPPAAAKAEAAGFKLNLAPDRERQPPPQPVHAGQPAQAPPPPAQPPAASSCGGRSVSITGPLPFTAVVGAFGTAFILPSAAASSPSSYGGSVSITGTTRPPPPPPPPRRRRRRHLR